MPPELAKLGLRRVVSNPHKRMIISSRAHDKTGKTHFAMTAPGPIYYAGTEDGDEGVVDRLAETLQKVVVQKDFTIPPNKKDKGLYEKIWDEFASTWVAVCDSKKFRTLVVDNTGDLWALIRLARFGKLTQVMPENYGPVTAEFEELMNYPKKFPNLNVVYIHRLTKEYKPGKDGNKRGEWTGQYEMKGCNSMPYLVQVNIEHFRYLRDDNKRGFGIRIINSRLNGSTDGVELTDNFEGLGIDMCNFQSLGVTMFPESTEDDWK